MRRICLTWVRETPECHLVHVTWCYSVWSCAPYIGPFSVRYFLLLMCTAFSILSALYRLSSQLCDVVMWHFWFSARTVQQRVTVHRHRKWNPLRIVPTRLSIQASGRNSATLAIMRSGRLFKLEARNQRHATMWVLSSWCGSLEQTQHGFFVCMAILIFLCWC